MKKKMKKTLKDKKIKKNFERENFEFSEKEKNVSENLKHSGIQVCWDFFNFLDHF